MALADIFTRPDSVLSSGIYNGLQRIYNRRRKPTLIGKLVTAAKAHDATSPITLPIQRAPVIVQADTQSDVPAKLPLPKKLQRMLLISSASLGISLVGAPMLSPLGILSMSGFLYGATPIFRGAYKTLRKDQKANVDVLIAIISAVCLTQGYLVAGNLAVWFNALRLILLEKVKHDAQKSVFDVYQLQPHTVWLLTKDTVTEVPFADVQVNDIVVVGAGEMIPVDGIIVDGIASIDQQILTGEAQPVEKEPGAQVFACTVVLMGSIQIRVERTGMETTVALIAETINQARDFKTALQLRTEAFADQTILPTLLLSALSLPLIGPLGALVILNAHFGYRLSVIGAISILNYLNIAGKHGILIKDGRALDLLQQVDTVVFDKTGTLTQEQPHVAKIHACAGYSEMEILRYAASAEFRQTHPIARAILKEAQGCHLSILAVDEADYKVGYGLKVMLDQQAVWVGSRRFMEMEAIKIPEEINTAQEFCHRQGHSLVWVAVDQQVVGALEIHATVRPEARFIISQLKRHYGIHECYIISGDHTAPTQKLAHDLGIDHYFAETLPHQKAELIEQLRAAGKTVCYVGDGINDAIALQKADVSISLSGASTIATDTAQIVLMDGSLQQLERLFHLGRAFDKNMKVNFASIIVPSVLGIGGAFFLHFGLIHSIVFNQIGFVAGVGNAMVPLAQQTKYLTESSAPVTPSTTLATA